MLGAMRMGRWKICIGFGLCLLSAVPGLAGNFTDSWREALAERYAPYLAEPSAWIARLSAVDGAPDTWWQTPEAFRATVMDEPGPLAGLHVALDPGHIGGIYAEGEGRDFKIAETDFRVREGELSLLVAQFLEVQLETLGARVTLLRSAHTPVIEVDPVSQLRKVARRLPAPRDGSLGAWIDHAQALRRAYFQETYVRGELAARAERVNREIRPDLLLSLHTNAAPWPREPLARGEQRLVASNHCHVLIFGGVSEAELRSPGQLHQLGLKLQNGSGPVEQALGAALGEALGAALNLPPSVYDGQNAVRMEAGGGYLWARNLLLLRQVACPVVLLEPFLANSTEGYARLQAALRTRAAGEPIGDDDILQVYADAVVAALLEVYGRRVSE